MGLNIFADHSLATTQHKGTSSLSKALQLPVTVSAPSIKSTIRSYLLPNEEITFINVLLTALAMMLVFLTSS